MALNFEAQLMSDLLARHMHAANLTAEQAVQTKQLRSRLRVRIVSGNERERGIEQIFAKTLGHLIFTNESLRQEVLDDFLLSEEFRNVREIPCHSTSLCVEEAFYWFLQSHDRLPKDVSKIAYDDVMKELMTLIASSGERWFHTRLAIAFNGRSHFSISSNNAGAPLLYAAAKRQLIAGPVSPEIVSILMKSVEDFANGNSEGPEDSVSGSGKVRKALQTLGLI